MISRKQLKTGTKKNLFGLISGKFIDIALPDKMIAIEYDGSYGHSGDREERDKIRQEYLESFGWNFIRYRDYVPSKEEISNDIDRILTEEK